MSIPLLSANWQKLRIIHPKNAPQITAGVVYQTDRGLQFHSIRDNGIHAKSNAIQIDANVLDQLEALGCEIVSVATNGRTYLTTVATLRQRGRFVSTRFGLQLALHLKWWSTNGAPIMQTQPVQATHSQLSIFEVAP